MRSFFSNKVWVLFLAVLALAALVELATGLESMSFRNGHSFGRKEAAPLGGAVDIGTVLTTVPLKTQIVVWILVVMMFVFIAALFSPELRRRLIRFIIRMALTYWVLYYVLTRHPEILGQLGSSIAALASLPSALGTDGEPPPAFVPPRDDAWIGYIVSFIVAAILVFAAWRLYSSWREINALNAASSAERLARIARTSLQDLSSGRNSTDVILNCYFRMSDVVSDKKRLKRNEGMTPAEFALRLEHAGLPGDAVKRLTRLFESVRYGGHKTDSRMVNEAVACLTTILHYCGESV